LSHILQDENESKNPELVNCRGFQVNYYHDGLQSRGNQLGVKEAIKVIRILGRLLEPFHIALLLLSLVRGIPFLLTEVLTYIQIGYHSASVRMDRLMQLWQQQLPD